MSIFNRAPHAQLVTAPVRDQVVEACVKLGVDLNPDHAEALTIADLVRLAYREGVRATEKRLMSPDVADAIAVAIECPEMVVEDPGYIGPSSGKLRWQVNAVQQAAVYGVPK